MPFLFALLSHADTMKAVSLILHAAASIVEQYSPQYTIASRVARAVDAAVNAAGAPPPPAQTVVAIPVK